MAKFKLFSNGQLMTSILNYFNIFWDWVSPARLRILLYFSTHRILKFVTQYQFKEVPLIDFHTDKKRAYSTRLPDEKSQLLVSYTNWGTES